MELKQQTLPWSYTSSSHVINDLENTTFRQILRATAQTFDPMGWLAPATIRARVLIQTLHREKYSWDEPVDQKHILQWKEIFNDLQDVGTIMIPRFTVTIIRPGSCSPNNRTIHSAFRAACNSHRYKSLTLRPIRIINTSQYIYDMERLIMCTILDKQPNKRSFQRLHC